MTTLYDKIHRSLPDTPAHHQGIVFGEVVLAILALAAVCWLLHVIGEHLHAREVTRDAERERNQTNTRLERFLQRPAFVTANPIDSHCLHVEDMRPSFEGTRLLSDEEIGERHWGGKGEVGS